MRTNHTRTIFVALIVSLGTLVGLAFALLGLNGTFAQWEYIGAPPDKPTKILAGEFDSYPGGLWYRGRETSIYIDTLPRNIYLCCGNERSKFVETQREDVKELNAYDCLGTATPEARHLSDEIDYYAVYYCGEWDAGTTYYSIDERGTVWRMKTYTRFPDFVVQLCVYPVVGLVLGLWIVWTIEEHMESDSPPVWL